MEDTSAFINEVAAAEKEAESILEKARAEAQKRKELLSNTLSAREEEWKRKIEREKEKLLKEYEARIKEIKAQLEEKKRAALKEVNSTRVSKDIIEGMADLLAE